MMEYNNQLNDDKEMLRSAGFKAIAEQYEEMVIILQRAVMRYDELSDKEFRDQFFTLAALKLRRFTNEQQKPV